jgi:beta-glucosidase
VKAGCDVSSGGMGQKPDVDAMQNGHANNGIKGGWGFVALPDAVNQGLISEEAVNAAVKRELTMRMKLGLFDPPADVPWSKLGLESVDSPEHRQLALKVAQESMVLLKNEGNLLPLERGKYKRIAVIGPNADFERMQSGNYTGRGVKTVTILAGIKELAGDGVEVTFNKGCPLAVRRDGSDAPKPELAQRAIDAAKAADLVIYVGGLDFNLEKEEGGANADVYKGFSRGDRVQIEYPEVQEDLIRALQASGKPMVLVNCSGSAIAMPWEDEHVPAIVQAWYPGEEGGKAVAQVLFGEVNPAGRMPVTVYKSTEDLPKFEDYSMNNRTYRYFTGKPLYAFGYGLSYTKFDYADAKVNVPSVEGDETIKLSFTMKNTGGRDGDEVAQVYFTPANPTADGRKRALCGFKRVHIASGGASPVEVEIPVQRLRHWDDAKNRYVVDPGDYVLHVGGASDDERQSIHVTVKG